MITTFEECLAACFLALAIIIYLVIQNTINS